MWSGVVRRGCGVASGVWPGRQVWGGMGRCGGQQLTRGRMIPRRDIETQGVEVRVKRREEMDA